MAISLDKFQEQIKERLLNEGLTIYKEEEGCFGVSSGEVKLEVSLFNFLDRINSELRSMGNNATEKDVENFIDRTFEQILTVLKQAIDMQDVKFKYEHMKKSIYPFIKGGQYNLNTEDKQKPIMEKIAEGLYCAYVVDTGQSVAYISSAMLEEWGVKLEELKEVALSNFKRDYSSEPRFVRENVFCYNEKDSYDATRLLLSDQIIKLKEKIKGRLLFAIPNRDFFILFGENPTSTRKKISKQVFFDYQTMDYSISPYVYEYLDGKIIKYMG